MSSADTYLKPRLCHLLKWPDFNGYGFNLHAEKGKAGQYIGKVDEGSPAQAAGLKDGDRIVEVNGTNIGNENHQQVVSRIKAGGEETKLLVVDSETDKHYKDEKKVVKGDLPEVVVIKCPSHDPEPEPEQPSVQEEVPPSYNDATEQAATITSSHVEEVQTSVITTTTTSNQFIPRNCHLKKRPDFNGYGFNLHAERDKPGQYIGKIDDDSPALAADLREGDRIIEVNGTNIEGENHQRVIELIKGGGDETRLLVVDKATDEHYKEQNTTISSTLPEVRHTSSVKDVSAVVENPPVFHIPPPPTDLPPPEEEEEDFNVDELRNLALNDEAAEEVVAATQVAEVEAEVTPPEDIPPPPEDVVENDHQVEQQFSTEVVETVEAVAVDTETSAAVTEEVTQNTEELTQNSEEVIEAPPEIGNLQEIASSFVQNDIEVTPAAEAEVEIAQDVPPAVEEEIKENFVTEIAENAATNAVNGQSAPSEPVTTYTPPAPEPEPEPTPAPEPVSQSIAATEPPKQANGTADPIFSLSAAEMKARLKSKKKADPRLNAMSFNKKHEVFERM